MSHASQIVLFSITLVLETLSKRLYLESRRSEASHGVLDNVGNNLKEPHIATLSCFCGMLSPLRVQKVMMGLFLLGSALL